MNQKEYFLSKEDKNNNINNKRKYSKESKSNIRNTRDNNSFVINELNPEQIPPINKDSFIKGLTLVFIYFSVIIYSLLYMLTPEKSANLIFEGNLDSSSINDSLLNKNNIFYKLDTIRERDNMTIFGISKNFLYVNDSKNDLTIEIIYSQNRKIINKIVIINNSISKEINKDMKIYHYYKINDFPFWITFFNKDNKDKINITSDKLINISFDV